MNVLDLAFGMGMCLHLDRGQGIIRSLVRYRHFGLMYNICEQLEMMMHVHGVSYIGKKDNFNICLYSIYQVLEGQCGA